MAAKPDIEHLENLVAEGRHVEALEGYLKLLTLRPGDPLLRSRVEMLKEHQNSSNDSFVAPMEAQAGFVITQEEVADGYVLAGRLDDALVLLEKLFAQRPNDKAIAERVERVRKLHAATPLPAEPPGPPPRTPKPPPANIIKAGTIPPQVRPEMRPAAGTPVTAGRTLRGPGSVGARPLPPKPRVPDAVEAAAATLIMGQANRGSAAVVTDEHLDKNEERTLRSAPPPTRASRNRVVAPAVVAESTVVSAPPSASRGKGETSEELPTMSHHSEADEFSSSTLATVVDLRKDDVEEVVNTLTSAPPELAQEMRAARQREEDARAFQEPTRVAREPSPPSSAHGLRQSIADRARTESPLKKPGHNKKS